MLKPMNRRVVVIISGSFFLRVTLVALVCFAGLSSNISFIELVLMGFSGRNITSSSPHRKLLHHESSRKQPDRIWGEKCTTADIVINQGPTTPLPSGIPTYTVEIMNVCVTGCDISRIHLNCGWFSSAHLINPKIFKRIRYNDCLVNDGKPLANGGTLSFQYANTYPYPLSVSSVFCA